MELLPVGCSLWPHLLLVEVGFLGYRRNKNSLKPPREDEVSLKVYFWFNIKGVPFQGPISLCPTMGKVPFCLQ